MVSRAASRAIALLVSSAPLLGAAAVHAIDVPGNAVFVRWAQATGPVGAYAIYVNRNGRGYDSFPEALVGADDRLYELRGQTGESVRVRVAALDTQRSRLGPYSPDSDRIRFVAPPRNDPPEPPRAAPPPPSPRSVVRNGSFEQGPNPGGAITLQSHSSTLPGWEVIGNSIDWVGRRWTAAHGKRSVDLNGFRAGGLRQTLELENGRYAIVFSLSGNPKEGDPIKRVRVKANGKKREYEFDTRGRSPSRMGWTRVEPFVVKVKRRLKLDFVSVGKENNKSSGGPVIDDVVVYRVGD